MRLFVRRDSYERFYSCLVYVPRDRYNTEVRERIERIVRAAFRRHARRDARCRSPTPCWRACTCWCARRRARARSKTSPAIEAEIAAAAATWEDRLQQALIARGVERERRRTRDALCARVSARLSRRRRAGAGARRHRRSRSARRRSRGAAAQSARAARRPAGPRCRLRILRAGEPISISDILPMLENFGLRVLAEHPYQVTAASARSWIQDFELEARDLEARRHRRARAAVQGSVPRRVARRDRERRLQPAAAVRRPERARNRGGARLLPLPAADRHSVQPGLHGTRAGRAGADRRGAGAAVPDAVRARAARRAKRAAERIRQAHPARARQGREPRRRPHPAQLSRRDPRHAAHQLLSDHGRRPATPKSWVSFKLDPHAIPDLPLPRPKFEIFVYSPRVEGVHLRMGVRRARRPALVGPARGLPHRSARAS